MKPLLGLACVVLSSIAVLSFLLLAAAAGLGSSRTASNDLTQSAQSGLPAGSWVDRPLHRAPDGRIEAIAPGSVGPYRCPSGAICVGEGQAYHLVSDALTAARPGGVIEIVGGTYREAVAIRAAGITIRGVAGVPRFNCTDLRGEEHDACILIAGDGVTLENIEIGAAAGSGACILNEPGMQFTLRRISCHGHRTGLVAFGGSVVIENSEFFDNGSSERAHNVDLGGDCDSAIVRGSTFRDAPAGEEFVSRCKRTEISDSTFRNTHGGCVLDIPDGGETMVYRSTLVKSAAAQSPEIVGFTTESCAHPGNLVLKDVIIINDRPDATIHNFDRCNGAAIIIESIKLQGLPFREAGYVLQR
jgi:Right handed beta helix region